MDDDPGMRETLADIFAEQGFQVLLAADGLEAVRRFEDSDVDLVLMDIRMPHLNGVEVLRRIREADPTQPVLLMTAYSMEGLLSEAEALSPQGILSKPLEWGPLLEMVEELVAARA